MIGLAALLAGACLVLCARGGGTSATSALRFDTSADAGSSVRTPSAGTPRERSSTSAPDEEREPRPEAQPGSPRARFEEVRRRYESGESGDEDAVLAALLARTTPAPRDGEDLASTLLRLLTTRAQADPRARRLLERAIDATQPALRRDLRCRALGAFARHADPGRLLLVATRELRTAGDLELASLLAGLAEHPDRRAAEAAAAILGSRLPETPASIHF